MKVKELLEILRETEFSCRQNIYKNNNNQFIGYNGISMFKFNEFGKWEYGWTNRGKKAFAIIEKDGVIYRKYDNFKTMFDDIEVMELEVVKIRSFKLFDDLMQSYSETNWQNNSSQIEIIVK